ncbi:class I SAM-dependent methyltransferase [Streptomyces sp. NPDC006368]|uniref:class I SAM-dependent DNA methyltransferase n=1 Tax=Streptomyces sp. NPDC006368 TaxID=3156760 RepID=UPI0033B37B24
MSTVVGPDGTTQTESLRFFGVFELLRTMNLPRTRVLPVYSGYFAALYDALSQEYVWDFPLVRELTSDGPKDILELGCGSGRIALPLARAGHRVVGVDRSTDMLTLFRRKLSAEDQRVADRVELLQQDMRAVTAGRTFDLVLLPANNVSLLASAADRLAVFTKAREHLAPHGRFVFDNALLEPERLLRQNQDLSVVPASTASAQQFVISAHRYFPDERAQVMNFYAESVAPDGMTERHLGSWTKAVLDEEQVLDLVGAAGMRVVDCRVCEVDHDHRRMKLYVCAPA